jgi:K+-transporting ATPase ATPase B chain
VHRSPGWLYGGFTRGSSSDAVLFAAETAAVAATVLFLGQITTTGGAEARFIGQVAGWLWFTVCYSSLVGVIAEGHHITRTRGLRTDQTEGTVKRLRTENTKDGLPGGDTSRTFERVPADTLRPGVVILVEAGDTIPTDGEVIEGVAEVDESPITGESAPVIRESGGGRSAVIGGTRVVSDWLKVRVTANPGDSFLDHIATIVEDTKRLRSSREGVLSIALVGVTLIATIACTVVAGAGVISDGMAVAGMAVALFAALLPVVTAASATVARLGGIGRLLSANIIAKSAEAIEAAGRVATVLLDKTGTITVGNRQAKEFLTLSGVSETDLAETALLASLGDETPEGRSIVALAEKALGKANPKGRVTTPIPFSAQTRLSGARLVDGCEVWKGASDAVLAKISAAETDDLLSITQTIARAGGTPLLVAKDRSLLGIIHLDDTVKPGLRNRFAQLRRMGIRTVMITGDNPLTAATVAAESGVDDYVARATPASKLDVIRSEQAKGNTTAMCGDGVNDAPALKQADVGLAMGLNTAAAREAGNMIDLDSDPLKLMELVRIGRWITYRRRTLGILALASDAGKYVAVIPPLLAAAYPALAQIQVLAPTSPRGAVLAAITFNALAVIVSLPLAWHSAAGTPRGRAYTPRSETLILAIGGFLAPVFVIPLIERALEALNLC